MTTAEEIRSELKRRLEARAAKGPALASPAPRYDDVFFKGVAWLDGLALGPCPVAGPNITCAWPTCGCP